MAAGERGKEKLQIEIRSRCHVLWYRICRQKSQAKVYWTRFSTCIQRYVCLSLWHSDNPALNRHTSLFDFVKLSIEPCTVEWLRFKTWKPLNFIEINSFFSSVFVVMIFQLACTQKFMKMVSNGLDTAFHSSISPRLNFKIFLSIQKTFLYIGPCFFLALLFPA